MQIKDILNQKQTFSIELFPPKKTDSFDKITSTLDNIEGLDIDFVSITYGAGGSTKDNTIELSKKIKHDYGIEVLTHLTCIDSNKEEITDILDYFKGSNIENILALRGDITNNLTPKTYNYASDLIKYVNSYSNFCIAGACYPESHPEASSRVSDIKNLRNKVNQGCDFLITQLFFDNNAFYDFKERLELIDINVPIIAGIMPVVNKKQIERIVNLTGCNFPNKFKRILEKYEYNPSALKDAGLAYATDQIIDLMSNDIDGIHLYIMNKPENARKILNNISSIR